MNKKKILIVSPSPTHPANAGNRSCIISYAELLKNCGYDVFFFWIGNWIDTKEEFKKTSNYWNPNFFYYKKGKTQRIIEALYRQVVFKRTGHYKLDSFYPIGVKRYIRKLNNAIHFDCVIINYVFLSRIFKFFCNSKKILFTHDVFSNRFEKTGNQWFSLKASSERKGLNRADIIMAIQDTEAEFFNSMTRKRVVTSYSFFPVYKTPIVNKRILLYIASSNPDNIKSFNWFYENVFTQLLLLYPEVHLIVGGKICGELKYLEKSCGVELQYEIVDLFNFYCQSDFFINPTTTGTGLKIKTFEALAYGKILLSHPHNCIGIYKRDSAPIMLVETPDEYINCIRFLFEKKHDEISKFKSRSTDYIQELNEIVKARFIKAIEM